MRFYDTSFGKVDFAFAGQPDVLAAAYTQWLWGNRESNPLWDKPDKWEASTFGVQFVDRPLNFTGVANGASPSLSLNLGGGKNVLVMSRVCAVTPTGLDTDPNLVTLPNQISNYVSVQQIRKDGLKIIEQMPIINCFGWGLAPYVMPLPERWVGNVEQVFTITNTAGYAVDVSFSWHIAFLHTGQ